MNSTNDMVTLKQKLEHGLGILFVQNQFLYKGTNNLRIHSGGWIMIFSTIKFLSWHSLHGLVVGIGFPSTSKPFSIRDVVKKSFAIWNASKSSCVLTIYILNHSSKVSMVDIKTPRVSHLHLIFEKCVFNFLFNNYWPPTLYLCHLISSTWTKNCDIFLFLNSCFHF